MKFLLDVRKTAKDGKEKLVNQTNDIFDKLDVSCLIKYSYFLLTEFGPITVISIMLYLYNPNYLFVTLHCRTSLKIGQSLRTTRKIS